MGQLGLGAAIEQPPPAPGCQPWRARVGVAGIAGSLTRISNDKTARLAWLLASDFRKEDRLVADAPEGAVERGP